MTPPSELARLAEQLEQHQKFSEAKCPPGWLTVRDLRLAFRFISLSSTSSKAKQLCDKGLLDRKAYQVTSLDGKRSWTYAYKPKKPLRNLDDVMIASKEIGQDRVPKGWVSAVTFSHLANISRSAVFQMAERHSLESRLYRVRGGACGIKPVRHFRLASLKKLHHLRGR
ncbi:hypothetical protein UFOVP779_23 [uncultured Caudovirales phage]|uniref:Uncharacterized protein n=1 Tax=uncultured Caudovirales phage TaxID=2100421 RepID=A0A6J5NTK4_9CAUD|nr:hypothetical protein UFOVP779_23 [uncultured Caudovirales phage]